MVRLAMFYVSESVTQASALLGPKPETFRDFLEQQNFFVFLIAVYVGSGLIAQDRKANALQIYLSKPLTRLDYIAGKMTILATFLLFVTWLPAMLLLLGQILLSGSFDFARDQPDPVPGHHACSRSSKCSSSAARCWRCRR